MSPEVTLLKKCVMECITCMKPDLNVGFSMTEQVTSRSLTWATYHTSREESVRGYPIWDTQIPGDRPIRSEGPYGALRVMRLFKFKT